MTRLCVAVTVIGVLAAGAVRARGAVINDDDLTLVRKAVGVQTTVLADPETEKESKPVLPEKARAAEKRKGPTPQWLKMRIIEKGQKKARVTINLPLELVRTLDDLPVDWHCHDGDRNHCPNDVAGVLALLESGTEILDIDDDESTVKIWLE